jgi:hypothetical protein
MKREQKDPEVVVLVRSEVDYNAPVWRVFLSATMMADVRVSPSFAIGLWNPRARTTDALWTSASART